MAISNIPTDSKQTAQTHSGVDTYLSGHQPTPSNRESEARHLPSLVAAWISFIAISAFALVIYVVGTPVFFSQLTSLRAACQSLGECLNPTLVKELHSVDLSVTIYAVYWVSVNVLFALIYLSVAILIVWRKPFDRMALLASFSLVAFGASFTSIPIVLVAIYPTWWLPVAILNSIGFPSLTVFLLLFPNGRFVPHWTRWIALGWATIYILKTFFPNSLFNLNNPFHLLRLLISLIVLGSIVIGQVYRYRRISTPVERQQTKWVVYGLAIALLGFLLLGYLPSSLLSLNYLAFLPLVFLITSNYVLLVLIPLTIAIAILRYRLWDVDALINRTLVYGALTTCVIGLYALVVGGLAALFQGQGNVVISLIATGLVAVLFSPLRDRLQRAVNHLMYGERDDPYRVITRLGHRLEATLAPDAVLPTIVETVAQALKLPYAAITLKSISATNSVLASSAEMQGSSLKQDGEYHIVASYGVSTDGLVRLPIIYHTEQLGELVLAPRESSEPFSTADSELLIELARQAGIAAHAVRLTTDLKHLTTDLQHSRERLVSTREEERRRMRRDLHDGLGPTLATITLKAEAARDIIPTDPSEAMNLLANLIDQAQTAINDIRRLVYDLRPPALDDLGLVAALRAQITQYEYTGLHITIDAPDCLPLLPAAVEVAAYRIIQEALTNMIRHADAHSCLIRLTPGKVLQVEIRDDGRGIPADHHAGVGLRSMHERAAELGGSCIVEVLPGGGTRVYATLPCELRETKIEVDAIE